MDRPASTTGHKRSNSSVPAKTPNNNNNSSTRTTSAASHHDAAAGLASAMAPSAVAMFVTNLRLLNFDLLPDWPGITTTALGNHDSRTRIRCTEFALYQLFRLYEPMTAADKLQPFFPPLEPLQSINLRAALFRCLNDLKKNGVIAKDTILRKTMLDECSGDKFWEICLAFSSIVLKKAALDRTELGKPIAETISTAQSISRSQKESMLPLAIAHKASLSRLLQTKQKRTDVLTRLHDVLSAKGTELHQRKARVQAGVGSRTTSAQMDKARSVEQTLRRGWIGGNADLRETLIYGDESGNIDSILTTPFHDVWAAQSPEDLQNSAHDFGILEDLQQRASRQSQRLRKWQNVHEKLTAAQPRSKRYSMLPTQSVNTDLQFDRHRNLTAHDPPDLDDDPPEVKKNPTVSRYDEILTAMREELRQNRLRPKPGPPPVAMHRSNTTPVHSSRRVDANVDPPGSERRDHQRSPSQTAVPFRPNIFGGRRVPSRSRSYQQPKIDSQRQPIPLKSELFSPLKTRRESTSPVSAGASYMASPIDGMHAPDSPSQSVDMLDPKRVSQSSAEGTVDSGVGLGVDEAFSTPRARPGSTSSDSILRTSLTERTRKSVAFSNTDEINGFLPDDHRYTPIPEPTKGTSAGATEESVTASAFDRRASLLDRTRQSISLAPTPSQHAPASRKHSPTRSYPVNQFETPKKQQPRDITPREELFSPDAGYDSVFKARPKVALSPLVSPHVDSKRASMESYQDDLAS